MVENFKPNPDMEPQHIQESFFNERKALPIPYKQKLGYLQSSINPQEFRELLDQGTVVIKNYNEKRALGTYGAGRMRPGNIFEGKISENTEVVVKVVSVREYKEENGLRIEAELEI